MALCGPPRPPCEPLETVSTRSNHGRESPTVGPVSTPMVRMENLESHFALPGCWRASFASVVHPSAFFEIDRTSSYPTIAPGGNRWKPVVQPSGCADSFSNLSMSWYWSESEKLRPTEKFVCSGGKSPRENRSGNMTPETSPREKCGKSGLVSVRKHNAPFQRDTVAVWCVAAPHRWPRIAFGAAPASRLTVSL